MMRLSRQGRQARLSRVSGAIGGGGGGGGLAGAIEALSPPAYWKLDDAATEFASSGTTSVTAGGLVGSPTFQGQAGPDGGSYVVMSSGNYILIPTHTEVEATTSKTVCFAYRATSDLATAYFLFKGARYTREYTVAAVSGYSVALFRSASQTIYRNRSSAVAGTENQWNFVVATINRDAQPEIWANSTTKLTGSSQAAAGTAPTARPEGLMVGAFQGLATTYFLAGAMAHLAVFEGVLSDAQIEGLITAAVDEGWTV